MRITDDTTAVVIGGGGGIGRGTALGLAAKGARLVIADIELETATRVADELRSLGATAEPVQVDATDSDSLRDLAETAEARVGPIDVLSNNVGVVTDVALVDASEQDWAWVIEFNLMSIVRACTVIVPRMLAHGRPGHVVNTASMAALFASTPEQVGGVRLGLYTTTKHAVLGYTETLRGELAPAGIGVSCFCPGMVDSNLRATSLRNRPARHGGPVEAADTVGLIPQAMAQEDIGPVVVAAIEADRSHVLTHPEARAIVDARAAALAADFDFFDESG